MLNFVLCDDNSNILKQTCKMLESIFVKYDYDANIAFSSTCANDILEFVKSNKVDVLLLDINLKEDITGIELAKQVRDFNKDVYLIFTTGHLEYAMLAYKVKTFDYLPKPITPERFEETIVRLFEDMSKCNQKFIKVNSSIVNQNDIRYIKRDGMKIVFCTACKEYPTYSSFNKIKAMLGNNFVRCHKSYIANLNRISNIDSSNNMILFDNKSFCYIGPKYKNNFMEVFKNGFFSNNMDSTNNTKSNVN